MEHLSNLQSQIQANQQTNADLEYQLSQLQSDFLSFREQKLAKESDLTAQLTRLKQESDNLKRDHELALHSLRLVCETEKLQLKSEMEVRISILQKELDQTREDRLRIKLETAERIRQMEQEFKEMTVQMQDTREEAIIKGAFEGQNEELISQNQELKEQIQIQKT